jgi:hypothetical protein
LLTRELVRLGDRPRNRQDQRIPLGFQNRSGA